MSRLVAATRLHKTTLLLSRAAFHNRNDILRNLIDKVQRAMIVVSLEANDQRPINIHNKSEWPIVERSAWPIHARNLPSQGVMHVL